MTLDPRKLNHDRFTFTNDDLSQDNDINQENDSIYTLEDDLSETHLDQEEEEEHEEGESTRLQHPTGKYGIYNLPTHIASHRDVLEDDLSRTQPSTPVGSPYEERPNHPLRALTSTHLVLNQQNGTDDSLISLDATLEPNIGYNATSLQQAEQAVEQIGENEDEDDWEKKGVAQAIKRETNELTGETDEVIIRRSVKDFKFGKTLGVGSYSTVLLATDKNTSKNYAVKVLDKRHIIREKKVKYVNIEKNTLNRLGKRDGLIHLFFTFQDESSLYFVLDFASNGELLTLIKNYGTFNEETTRYYGAQILDAIKYMHDNGVVHRDLKPENILLNDNNRIQITDFGTAKLLEKSATTGKYPLDTKAKSFVGTAEYVSPELLNEKSIGKPCDIWAFGCIVYQMISGKPPFKAPNDYLTFQKIIKLQYAFTAGFPMALRDLIKKILVVNPKDRIIIKEIQTHYFFQSIDFTNPEESIWKPNPPEEIGPYKINAKSMLPIPELSGSQSRLKINLPRSAATSRKPSSSSSMAANAASSSSLPLEAETSNDVDSSPSLPTQSQQVLMKAKAAVAARKQQQQEGKRNVSGANAANAASIALSRQPNDIIKAYNDKQEKDKKIKQEVDRVRNSQQGGSIRVPSSTEEIQTPPLSASSNFNQSPGNSGSRPKSASHNLMTLRKKPPQTSTATTASTQMTTLDLQFSDYLQNIEERVIKKGSVNSYSTTVDAIEKRYRGRLVDSPLGGNKSTTSSLLTQVANGSLSGLRNLGADDEHNRSKGVIHYKSEKDENKGTTKNKFRNFFKGGASEDEKKGRTLIVTTNSRLLIFGEVDDTLELKTEINLSNSHIKVKELLPPSIVNQQQTNGLFLIESYPNAFVFETSQLNVTQWTNTIYKSKTMQNEKISQLLIDQDPSGDAGTVLGSDAAKSAAHLAAVVNSPPLSPATATTRESAELKSPTLFNSSKFEEPPRLPQKEDTNRQSSISKKKVKHEGMFKDLIRNKTANRNNLSHKELPNNGLLSYGLPKRDERVVNNGSGNSSSSSGAAAVSGSKNPLIAAAEAALLSQRSNDDAPSQSSSSASGSGSLDRSHGNGTPQTGKRLITGMNSRLLARSHDRRKK